MVAPHNRFFFPLALCYKHPERVNTKGNWHLSDFRNHYINVRVCDKKKRSTCKPRKEIVEFVRQSNFYVLVQTN